MKRTKANLITILKKCPTSPANTLHWNKFVSSHRRRYGIVLMFSVTGVYVSSVLYVHDISKYSSLYAVTTEVQGKLVIDARDRNSREQGFLVT